MRQRAAFTLLEVVVALALMGSVLVGSLLAFTQHRSQLAVATERIEATRIAEQLILELGAQPGGLPARGQGGVAGRSRWVWQISPIGATELATVPMQVVRLQIIATDPKLRTLVSVELVQSVSMP